MADSNLDPCNCHCDMCESSGWVFTDQICYYPLCEDSTHQIKSVVKSSIDQEWAIKTARDCATHAKEVGELMPTGKPTGKKVKERPYLVIVLSYGECHTFEFHTQDKKTIVMSLEDTIDVAINDVDAIIVVRSASSPYLLPPEMVQYWSLEDLMCHRTDNV